jgi:arylsulfatase A-like enzyme
MFTNYNGGEWLSRNAPLSHRRATLWEDGIRVPLILRSVPGQDREFMKEHVLAPLVMATRARRADPKSQSHEDAS